MLQRSPASRCRHVDVGHVERNLHCQEGLSRVTNLRIIRVRFNVGSQPEGRGPSEGHIRVLSNNCEWTFSCFLVVFIEYFIHYSDVFLRSHRTKWPSAEPQLIKLDILFSNSTAVDKTKSTEGPFTSGALDGTLHAAFKVKNEMSSSTFSKSAQNTKRFEHLLTNLGCWWRLCDKVKNPRTSEQWTFCGDFYVEENVTWLCKKCVLCKEIVLQGLCFVYNSLLYPVYTSLGCTHGFSPWCALTFIWSCAKSLSMLLVILMKPNYRVLFPSHLHRPCFVYIFCLKQSVGLFSLLQQQHNQIMRLFGLRQYSPQTL